MLERGKEENVAGLKAQVDSLTGQVKHSNPSFAPPTPKPRRTRLSSNPYASMSIDTLTEERVRLAGSRNDEGGARVVQLARQTKYIRSLES